MDDIPDLELNLSDTEEEETGAFARKYTVDLEHGATSPFSVRSEYVTFFFSLQPVTFPFIDMTQVSE